MLWRVSSVLEELSRNLERMQPMLRESERERKKSEGAILKGAVREVGLMANSYVILCEVLK